MKSIAAIALVCLTSLGSVFSQGEAEKRQLAFNRIPLKASADHQYYVPASIDGKSFAFLLDTGCAYSTVLTEGFAKELGAELEPAGSSSGIGGEVETFTSNVGQIRFTPQLAYKFKNTHVRALPNLDGTDLGEIKVRGLLGAQSLFAMRAVFDTESTSILVPPSEASKGAYSKALKSQGALVLRLAKGGYAYPMLKVKLKDKDLVFLVDTGATVNTLQPEVARALKLKPIGKPQDIVGGGKNAAKGVRKVKVEGPVFDSVAKLESIEFYVVETIGDKLVADGETYGGIIGAGFLNSVRAKIDFSIYSLIIPTK